MADLLALFVMLDGQDEPNQRMARRRSRHHVDHLLNHDDNDSSEEEQRAAAAAEEDGGNGEDEEQEEEEEQRCSSPPRRRRRRMQQPPPPPPSSSAGAALPRRNAISGGANHDNNDSAPRHHQHPLSEYGDNTSPPCFELCGMQGIRLPMSKYKIRQYMDHRQRLVHALFCLSTELSAQGLGACMAFVYDILLLSHGVGCKFTANNKNMSLKTISFFFDEEIGCFHVYVAVNIGQAITKWVDLGNSLNASFVFIKKTPMDRTPLHVLMGKAFRDATAEVLSRNGNRMHVRAPSPHSLCFARASLSVFPARLTFSPLARQEYVLSRGGPRMSEGYSHNFVDALMASEGPAATTPAAAQQGEPPSHHHHHHSQQQQPMRALPAPPLPSSASSSSFDYSPLFSASQPPPPPHPHDAALAAAPPSRQPSAQPAPPPPPPPPAVGAGGGGGVGPTLPPVSGLAAVPPAYLDFLSGRDLGSASKMRALRAMAWDHFHRLFGGMEILTKVYNTQPCYCIKAGVLLSKAFRRALGRPLGGGGQLPAAFDTSFYNAVITAGTGVDEGSRFAVALKKLCDQHAGLLDIPFSDFIGAIDPLSLLSVVVIELVTPFHPSARCWARELMCMRARACVCQVYREISPPHNTRNRDHGPYPLGRVLCLMIKVAAAAQPNLSSLHCC